MEYDLVEVLREVALTIDTADEDTVIDFTSGDLLLEAAREIEYLRSRISRLEGLA